MSALVKLAAGSRSNSYLRLSLALGVNKYVTKSGMGVELEGGQLIGMSGESNGERLESTVVKAGQKVNIHLGTINPTKYQVMLTANPALYSMGDVGHTAIIEPGDDVSLSVTFKAAKAVDLKDLPWVLRMYLLD